MNLMNVASANKKKVPVAVLGATGSVGQRFVSLLADHPWFELAVVAASERSAGKTYADATPWVQSTPLPRQAAGLVVRSTDPESVRDCPLVFSALDAAVAGDTEKTVADAGHLVVSNARSHRMDPAVPLVVPEVNAEHLALLEAQRRERGSGGGIVTNPNCSLRILDNVVPHIAGEEEKMEAESRKILGRLTSDGILQHGLTVSAQCNRVPVVDGHTLCVSVRLERRATTAELREAFDSFRGEPQTLGVPSAPERPIVCLDDPDGPQPRLHRDMQGGMATVIGRIRSCRVLDFKFVVLTHNTLRGAAGGAILVGELMRARGLV
jgi:aspartate-semialdehyde dehydrogenase